MLASLIKLAKAITPPAVQAVIAEFRNHHTLRFFGKTFTGTFSTFKEVNHNFRGAVVYNSQESEQEEIANFTSSQAAIQEAKRGISPQSTDHHSLLCALTATLSSQTPTILDIGGGAGETFAHLIYSCPKQSPSLIVYELPPIVETAKVIFKDEKRIHFVDYLTDLNQTIDIVFLGSSLQYFEDYPSLLNQIMAFHPRIIIIAYTPLTSAPTFVTAQVNMRERVIPIKVINREELINYLSRFDFVLINQNRSRSTAHFRNFLSPQNSSSVINLVFKAKS